MQNSYGQQGPSIQDVRTKPRYISYGQLIGVLGRNPTLTYISQSDAVYRVLTGNGSYILIDKNRKPMPVYPPISASPLSTQYTLLHWAVLGLMTAGVLTTITSPIIMVKAYTFIRHEGITDDPHVRQEAISIFICAGILMAIGTALTVLLFIHIVY